MKKNEISLTAIVVSHHRSDWLKRCVQHLIESARQAEIHFPEFNFKILININGKDPESSAVALRLKQEHPEKIAAVQESDVMMTPAESRNRLQKDATSSWLFFIDDDAYIDRPYFVSFLTCLGKFPNAIGFGGPNLTPHGSSRFQQSCGRALSSRLATLQARARYRKLGSARTSDERELILCNLIMKRDALGPNPFPGDFICAEENWMMANLTRQGSQLIHDPELVVWHERRKTLSDFTAQIYKYAYGRAQVIARRPHWGAGVYFFPLVCVAFATLSVLHMIVMGTIDRVFAGLLITYLVACLAAGFAKNTFEWRVCVLLPVIHIYYAAGLLRGLVDESRHRKRKLDHSPDRV